MDIDELFREKSNPLNLNRSRMRAVYYRPIQTNNGVQWQATKPLPADPFSISYYLAKGFKAKPPDGEVKEEGKIKCPLCDFQTETAFGLEVHLRSHRKKEE